MMTWSTWPDDQQAATQVPRNSGHPPGVYPAADSSTYVTNRPTRPHSSVSLRPARLLRRIARCPGSRWTHRVLAALRWSSSSLLSWRRVRMSETPGNEVVDTTPGRQTPYLRLDEVLADYAKSSLDALNDNFVGFYLLGSLAIGDFDLTSDVDFMIVTQNELSNDEVDLVQSCHTELISRDTRWVKHLEYSFFSLQKLGDLSSPYTAGGQRNGSGDRKLWKFCNGSSTVERTDHDNTLVTRWTLRNRSPSVLGPEPSTFAPAVSPDELRREIQQSMTRWERRAIDDASEFDNRFHQVFMVLNNCRALQDLHEGRITSKPGGGTAGSDVEEDSAASALDRPVGVVSDCHRVVVCGQCLPQPLRPACERRVVTGVVLPGVVRRGTGVLVPPVAEDQLAVGVVHSRVVVAAPHEGADAIEPSWGTSIALTLGAGGRKAVVANTGRHRSEGALPVPVTVLVERLERGVGGPVAACSHDNHLGRRPRGVPQPVHRVGGGRSRLDGGQRQCQDGCENESGQKMEPVHRTWSMRSVHRRIQTLRSPTATLRCSATRAGSVAYVRSNLGAFSEKR